MRKVVIFTSIFAALLLSSILFRNYLLHKSPHQATFAVAHIKLSPVDNITFEGFRTALTDLGYIEGQNITYLQHPLVENVHQLTEIATNFATKKDIDLILVSSTPATLAVKQATAGTHIPVIFAPVNDPLAAGIVKDLKAPSANITGIQLPVGDKIRFNFLLQLDQTIQRVLLPYNSKDQSSIISLERVMEAAKYLNIELLKVPIANKQDLVTFLAGTPSTFDAIFLPRDSMIESHIHEFVALANTLKIPLSAPSSQQAARGALFSYGHKHVKIGGQAARLADQIFKGLQPAHLPVETAQCYLDINLKTAEKINLDIPDHLLRQSDTVIRQ